MKDCHKSLSIKHLRGPALISRWISTTYGAFGWVSGRGLWTPYFVFVNFAFVIGKVFEANYCDAYWARNKPGYSLRRFLYRLVDTLALLLMPLGYSSLNLVEADDSVVTKRATTAFVEAKGAKSNNCPSFGYVAKLIPVLGFADCVHFRSAVLTGVHELVVWVKPLLDLLE